MSPATASPTHPSGLDGRTRDRLLAALVWTGTLLVLFWPLARGVLTGEPRFFDWDVPEQYWPDLVRLCRGLHEGDIPYWSPHDRGGYPYYADPQAAPYHPMNWAICAVAGPSPSLHWATGRVLLGFVVAMIGGHVWLRRTEVGRAAPARPHSHAAAALGACVLTMAPFLRHNWELNLTLAIAWLPWVLWAIDRLLASPSARSAALVAFTFALGAWSGSPPALWLTGTFASGYLLVRLAARLRGDGLASFAALAPWLVSTALLTALLIAVVILPGQALSARSVQADHTFASLTAESLDPARLVALVTPQDGNHLFLGPVVWLATGAALSARRTRGAALACVLTAALAVLLTMGEHTPVFRFFFEHVAGFDRFRLPHRYEAWLGPVAALATTLGVDVMARELTLTRPSRAVFASWSLALTLAAAHVSLVTERLDPERHTRGGDLPCRDDDDEIAQIARDTSDRVFDEFALGCRSGTRLGHRDLRGYQDPLMLHAYERVLSRLGERPALLRQFGVRYALTSPHFLHGWDHHYLPRPEVLASLPGAHTTLRDDQRRVIELGEPVPRAYVVPQGELVSVATREEALERLARIAPRRVAILEAAGAQLEDEHVFRVASHDGVMRVEDPDDDTVVITLDDAPAGVLVSNDVYDVGWVAEVDGQPVEVVRVNALVRGVSIPTGAREVTFRFAPRDGRATRALWALGWLLGLMALAAPIRRRAA